MTSHEWIPDGTYGSIRAEAERRIFDMERRGAHSIDHAIHVTPMRAALDDHYTEDQVMGARCVGCSEPWPCGSIAGIFAPL